MLFYILKKDEKNMIIKEYLQFINENKNTDVYIGGGMKLGVVDDMDSRYYCFIKEKGELIQIGYIEISPMSDNYKYEDLKNKKFHIRELYLGSFTINEEYRGKGYGETFLKILIDKIKEWNVDYLTLFVSANNIGVSKLYKKLGFDFFNEQDYYTYDISKRIPNDESRWMVKKMK